MVLFIEILNLDRIYFYLKIKDAVEQNGRNFTLRMRILNVVIGVFIMGILAVHIVVIGQVCYSEDS